MCKWVASRCFGKGKVFKAMENTSQNINFIYIIEGEVYALITCLMKSSSMGIKAMVI